jgi:hypothetical protein
MSCCRNAKFLLNKSCRGSVCSTVLVKLSFIATFGCLATSNPVPLIAQQIFPSSFGEGAVSPPTQSRSLIDTIDERAGLSDHQWNAAEAAKEGMAGRDALSGKERQDLTRRITESVDRGVSFMLESQNADGSWGLPTRTKSLNIYAPVPGAHQAFRTAVTALGISALCEQERRRPEVAVAIDAAQIWMIENLGRLRRATPDAIYNVWGHGYAISALVALHERSDDDALKSQLRDLIETQFQRLADYESLDGGWGYYDFNVGAQRPTSSSTSFVNATVLVALHHARTISIQPPEGLVERALAATRRQQKPDFSYLYGEYLRFQPMRGINRPGGSLGRSQACNISLRYWNDPLITDEILIEWLRRLIDRHGWLDMGRKRPVPHEAWMQVAGYFFYYGHFYAALCLDELPAAEKMLIAPALAELLMERQEADGSWWDFPFYNYHPPYGTAFALMSLERHLQAIQ